MEQGKGTKTQKHGNISIFVPHLGCPNHCSFCNQHTITGQQQATTPDAVRKAVERALSGSYASHAKMEIAFFGGSFTAIPKRQMRDLLEAAFPYVKEGLVQGIRISTRPDCVGEETLECLRTYGVTTIELGAQSMEDEVLTANERGHTALDVEQASQRIQSYGFSLGLQMMTGLYGSTPASDWRTARRLIALKPAAVRIYPTVVLKGTALAQKVADGLYKPPSLEESVSFCAQLLPLFEDAGIPVIRLGLHSSREIEENYVCGAYHPAFRELVESHLLLKQVETRLDGWPKGTVTVVVPAGCTSKMIGQKKKNIALLASLGYQVTVKEDSSLSIKDGTIRLLPGLSGGNAERNG